MYEIYFDELKIEYLKNQLEEINYFILMPLIQNINIAISDMDPNVFLQAQYLLDKINQSTEKVEYSMHNNIEVLSKLNVSYSQTAKNISQKLDDILTEQLALYKSEETNTPATSSTIVDFYQNLRQLNAYLTDGIALQINPISISKFQEAFGRVIADVAIGHEDIKYIIFSKNASEISLPYVEELWKTYEQLELPYTVKPYSLLAFKGQTLNFSVSEESELKGYAVNYKDIFDSDWESVEAHESQELRNSTVGGIRKTDKLSIRQNEIDNLATNKGNPPEFVGLKNFLLSEESTIQNESLKIPTNFSHSVDSLPFWFVKDKEDDDLDRFRLDPIHFVLRDIFTLENHDYIHHNMIWKFPSKRIIELKPLRLRDELSTFISSIPFKFVWSDHEYEEKLPHIRVSEVKPTTRVKILDFPDDELNPIKVTPSSPSTIVVDENPATDPKEIYNLKYDHIHDTEMEPVLIHDGVAENLQKIQVNSVDTTEKGIIGGKDDYIIIDTRIPIIEKISWEFIEGTYSANDLKHLKYEIPEGRVTNFKPLRLRDELSTFISSIPFKFIRSEHEYKEELPHIGVSRAARPTKTIIPDFPHNEELNLIKVTPFSPSTKVGTENPDPDPREIYNLKYDHRYDTQMERVLLYDGISENLQKVQVGSMKMTEKEKIEEDGINELVYGKVSYIEKIVREFIEGKYDDDDLSRLKYKIPEGRTTEFKPLKLRDELSTFISSVPFKFVQSEYDEKLTYLEINKTHALQRIKISDLHEDEEFNLLKSIPISTSMKIKNEQLDPDAQEVDNLKFANRYDTQMGSVLMHEDKTEELRKTQVSSNKTTIKEDIKEDIIDDSNFLHAIVDEAQLKIPKLRETFNWNQEQAEQFIDKLYVSTANLNTSYMQDGGKAAYTLVLTILVKNVIQLGSKPAAKADKNKVVDTKIVTDSKKHKQSAKSLNESLFATDEEIAAMKYSAFELSAGKATLSSHTAVKPIEAVGTHYNMAKLSAMKDDIQKEAEQVWSHTVSAALAGVHPSERVSIERTFPLIIPGTAKAFSSEGKAEVTDNFVPVKNIKNSSTSNAFNTDKSTNTVEGIDFIDRNTSAELSSPTESGIASLSAAVALAAFSTAIKKKEDKLLAVSMWKNSIYESVIRQACESEMLESASKLLEKDDIFKNLSGGKAKRAMITDISPAISTAV